MDTNNKIINTPAQVPMFDISKLAEMAVLLRETDPGFFNKTSKQEMVVKYLKMLNEYSSIANIPAAAIKTTFKAVTGLEYDSIMNNKNTVSLTMAA